MNVFTASPKVFVTQLQSACAERQLFTLLYPFVFSSEDEDFKRVLFDDSLVTLSKDGNELGEFCVKVEEGTHEGSECWLVHANSHGLIDNVPCGSSVRTHVSHKLETLEQYHHEYVKV